MMTERCPVCLMAGALCLPLLCRAVWLWQPKAVVLSASL